MKSVSNKHLTFIYLILISGCCGLPLLDCYSAFNFENLNNKDTLNYYFDKTKDLELEIKLKPATGITGTLPKGFVQINFYLKNLTKEFIFLTQDDLNISLEDNGRIYKGETRKYDFKIDPLGTNSFYVNPDFRNLENFEENQILKLSIGNYFSEEKEIKFRLLRVQ